MQRRVAVFVFIVVSLAACTKNLPVGSSSMEPSIKKNSTVTINVFAYYSSLPSRWDIAVFENPDNGKMWLSRIIGLPGDSLVYSRDKHLSINGYQVNLESEGNYQSQDLNNLQLFKESDGTQSHEILIDPTAPFVMTNAIKNFPLHDNCIYTEQNISCKVPPDNYFVMGDNRDFSLDSRYWGFVPKANLAGRVAQ